MYFIFDKMIAARHIDLIGSECVNVSCAGRVVMTEKFDTPLAQAYKVLVERGLIIPIEPTGNFRYPSVLTPVPSITTYGVVRDQDQKRNPVAQLEPGPK